MNEEKPAESDLSWHTTLKVTILYRRKMFSAMLMSQADAKTPGRLVARTESVHNPPGKRMRFLVG